MTKMKLAPIELDKTSLRKGTKVYKQSVNPFVASRLYAAYEEMTVDCPTVEVVDIEELRKLLRKNFEGMHSEEWGILDVLECIFENGYKIIKEVE